MMSRDQGYHVAACLRRAMSEALAAGVPCSASLLDCREGIPAAFTRAAVRPSASGTLRARPDKVSRRRAAHSNLPLSGPLSAKLNPAVRYVTLAKLRRYSQVVFFALFLFLLFKTEFRGSFRSAQAEIRLPYPISIFLQADPLVAISNAISTRALYQGLLWSLVILIPTFFLGRFFCGWICPLGALNHFFSSWKSERKRGRARIESNRYKRWQTLKYYILIAVLVAALFGSEILGILDPISLTVRSLGLSILPGINYGFNALFDALYRTQVGALRFTADVLYFLLKETVLSFKQPYFRQGFFLGLIFITIMVLNLRITRFWCRALCPLGALLGLVSRWSILGLEKHPAIARTATAACSTARAETIRSRARSGAKRNAISASIALRTARKAGSSSSSSPARRPRLRARTSSAAERWPAWRPARRRFPSSAAPRGWRRNTTSG